MKVQHTVHTDGFFEQIENLRLITTQNSDEARKLEFSQFFTSAAISRYMASLFQDFDKPLSVLDPGAGIGNLSAAFVEKAINENDRIHSLHLTCYEIDPELNKRSAIPRHTEINNILAQKICKDLGVSAPKKK
jgi:adenine-specific DNA-methyltransferase